MLLLFWECILPPWVMTTRSTCPSSKLALQAGGEILGMFSKVFLTWPLGHLLHSVFFTCIDYVLPEVRNYGNWFILVPPVPTV